MAGSRTRSGPPTIVQVAELAGVSPMTVSRVLNGGSRVSPQTRERVDRAVATLGYRRNENARTLRPGQRTGLVGVAITNIANPYYGQVVLGIEDVVAPAGCRILLGTTGEDAEREGQLVDDFLGRRVDGLIIVPTHGIRRSLTESVTAGLPVVFASRTEPGVAVDAVVVDDVTGAYEATSALLSEGGGPVAYLGYSTSVFTGRRRYEGYRMAHADAGVEIDESLVLREGVDVERATEAAAALLELPVPPAGIFAANNRNGIGVLQAIARRHAAGPGRLEGRPPRVAVFDTIELATLIPMPLLMVGHDPRELGRRAGRLLLDRLQASDPGDQWIPRTLTIPVRMQRT